MEVLAAELAQIEQRVKSEDGIDAQIRTAAEAQKEIEPLQAIVDALRVVCEVIFSFITTAHESFYTDT